ncbi:HalOD1 output domain-containing protein [Natrinema salinisoli]|uniref:HalOD1 output domain-containing protein n=1 Tax=Natrinema salinisoli TaxID=2878535 RepID=UPI001CEFD809|nr:HalOD1 output domain-containing protein [Natrinema salinisoli]
MTKNENGRIHRFDSIADETPTEAVIRSHASLRDKQPIDLSPLADAIPCNALNALVNTGDEVTVTFTYEGTQTTVHGDGEIVIHEPA